MKNTKNKKLFFSMTSEFLNIYMPNQIGRSPNTIRAYKDSLTLYRRYINEELKKSLMDFEFAECSRDNVLGFMKYLKDKGDIASTRNGRLTAIKVYMDFASDKDMSLQSYALIIKKIHSFKTSQRIRPILTEKGLREILKQPEQTKKGIRNRVIMIMLYDTAARIDEILSLTLDNIHLNQGIPFITVIGKGDKERPISISQECKKHLLQYLSIYHGENFSKINLLFYISNKQGIKKLSECTVEWFVQKYADSARKSCPSIPEHVYPHLFRAYRATQLYQSDIPLEIIARLLGHSSVQTTKIYAIIAQSTLSDAMNKIQPDIPLSKVKLWKDKESKIANKCGLR